MHETIRHPANRLRWLLPILILWLATGLRFHNLDSQSFWNDEGNSARLSERSLTLIIEGTASDIHPPLYYILLRGWREMVGDHEFGLRSFSTFAGILTVAVTFAIARILNLSTRRNAGASTIVALAGILAAINPTLVYYSQETRMYALLALLGALSTLILLILLSARNRWPWALAYVMFTVAGLYTHYFFPSLLVLQGLIILLWVLRKQVTLIFAPLQLTAEPHWSRTPLVWLALVATSMILYLPWMPTFLRQAGGRATERTPIPIFLWDSVRWMSFGETISDSDLIWTTVLVIMLLAWAVVTGGRRIIVPFLAVLVPITAMYFAGTTNPAFFKFMLTAVPFLLIWMSASINFSVQDRKPILRPIIYIVPSLLLFPVFLGMLFSLLNLYGNAAFARADYRGIAAQIAGDGQLNAGIILDAPNQWEVFTYYHREGAPVYPLPKGRPDPDIVEQQLADIADRHDRLYVLFWGQDQQDPQHIVERWLDTNTYRASEKWVGNVRLVVYSATSDEMDNPQVSADVSFGKQISLNSYKLDKAVVATGDVIQVDLFWSALNPVDKRYKVFLHLVDQDGTIIAQQDGEPVGGMSPTNSWQPGTSIVDHQGVLLPDDLAPGEYELLVGLYESGDAGQRLPIEDGEHELDSLSLGRIIVE